MVKLVYPIHSSWIGKIVQALTDHLNAVFCLAMSPVVVRGGHLKLDLKVLHKPLPEV
jgi:hypothetical protein